MQNFSKKEFYLAIKSYIYTIWKSFMAKIKAKNRCKISGGAGPRPRQAKPIQMLKVL